MFDLASPDLPAAASPPIASRAEDYLVLLHPPCGHGLVGGLSVQGDRVRSHTWERDGISRIAATLTEQEAYIAMNPYHGPRGGSRRLAGLNAVWLDLDTYRVPSLANSSRADIADHILRTLGGAGLPEPSFLVDSGRGYYCIWLLSGAAPAALPRWRAVMRALTDWARPLGADPACIDPARVLRLPGSWHDGAGRQVEVLGGDGSRHPFEPLADTIWRVAGRPTRRALDMARQARTCRSPRQAKKPATPRGLPRRAFWKEISRDLDILLEHWGGVVPVGMRDLWLHLLACSLTWAAPDTDISALVVARAGAVAPGLKPADIARTMRPTLRRGAAALRHEAGKRDRRYDYGSARMCELLAVDRSIAATLGLRQLVPADLRAERNRKRRRERSRAAGAMPRALWLAANPTNREQPWLAEGISRATWYRRRAAAGRCQVSSALRALMAGAARLQAPRETGPVPLYRGEALPPHITGRSEGPDTGQSLITPLRTAPLRRKTTPTIKAEDGAAPIPAVSGEDAVTRSHDTKFTMEPNVTDTNIDTDVLSEACKQLSHAEVGALTCVALALKRGPARIIDLPRCTGVPPDLLDRLGAWLRISAESGEVIGLKVPASASRRPRGPRQALLFDEASAAPERVSTRRPGSLQAATIAAGVRILGRAGVSETVSRPFLGRILRDNGFGMLAEALDALEPKLDDVADPRSWLSGHLKHRINSGSSAGKNMRTAASSTPPSSPPRPLATPEFLGISPGLAASIRERNQELRERSRRLFGDRS